MEYIPPTVLSVTNRERFCFLERFSPLDFLLDCSQPSLIGNGNCNYETNTAECNFDGGDCCSLCERIIISLQDNIISLQNHTSLALGNQSDSCGIS